MHLVQQTLLLKNFMFRLGVLKMCFFLGIVLYCTFPFDDVVFKKRLQVKSWSCLESGNTGSLVWISALQLLILNPSNLKSSLSLAFDSSVMSSWLSRKAVRFASIPRTLSRLAWQWDLLQGCLNLGVLSKSLRVLHMFPESMLVLKHSLS